MSTIEKLIKSVFSSSSITYKDAEKILFKLGFFLKVTGSHHIFTKKNYDENISLKKRKELLPYQIKKLKQVLLDHGYKSEKK